MSSPSGGQGPLRPRDLGEGAVFSRALARVCLGFAKFDHFVLLMAGFLDFCEDFFAANCANDANGPPAITAMWAILCGSDFGCGLPRSTSEETADCCNRAFLSLFFCS